MGTTAVMVVIDADIWQSIMNRKGNIKTAEAIEYLCLKYLTESYPKEKELGAKFSIDSDAHSKVRKEFDEILKEVRGVKND